MMTRKKAEKYAAAVNGVMPRLINLVDSKTQIGVFSLKKVLPWREIKDEFGVNASVLIELLRGLGMLRNTARLGREGSYWWVDTEYCPTTAARVTACEMTRPGKIDVVLPVEMQVAIMRKRRTEMMRDLERLGVILSELQS